MSAIASATRNALGSIGLVVAAMAAFALQDIVVKLVSDEVSLWQLMLVRSTATLGLMVGIIAAMGWGTQLVPKHWTWPIIRAVFMCGAYLFFYAALPFLTVSVAAATFFTGPLIITLLAALMLGEPIGPRRILAVIIGFAGVLVIIRPGAGEWHVAAFLPLGAALCYAFGTVITRWRCRDEPNFALSMVHNLVYANIGMLGVLLLPLAPLSEETARTLPFLAGAWLTPTALAVTLMLATAATHLVGVLCIVRAYQGEDASVVAPFEYTYLAIIPVLEFLIWQTLPDTWTLTGMALITAAGVFVAWREGRPVRPRVHTQGEDPWTPDTADGKDR